MFLIPSGAAVKAYINEITRLMNAWNNNSSIGNIALKALHLMPRLLLEKPRKTSKTKDHIKALERRIEFGIKET